MSLNPPSTVKREFNSPLAQLELSTVNLLSLTPLSCSKPPSAAELESAPNFIPGHLMAYPNETLQSLKLHETTIPPSYPTLVLPQDQFHKLFRCATALRLSTHCRFAVLDTFHKIYSNFDVAAKFAPVACCVVSICSKFEPNFGQFSTLKRVVNVLFGAQQPGLQKLISWEYAVLDALEWRAESVNAWTFAEFFGAACHFDRLSMAFYEYLLAICYLDSQIYHFKPLKIAAAGASLTLEKFKGIKFTVNLKQWSGVEYQDICAEIQYIKEKFRQGKVVRGFLHEYYSSAEMGRVSVVGSDANCIFE
ncbi:Cyclin A [Spironucleus salmonicida]|uniref:Cyclin A n=1 Tax=Spironucleus salmonicida TaxID=348837 RepID=V6LNI5_9EUKA|nr:Cyclin A [Spironucleus salmonicida]|eukprot:EST42299.1 Cyclin A [Spironucleus salmonicida]